MQSKTTERMRGEATMSGVYGVSSSENCGVKDMAIYVPATAHPLLRVMQ
jgi:hypothetical protein